MEKGSRDEGEQNTNATQYKQGKMKMKHETYTRSRPPPLRAALRHRAARGRCDALHIPSLIAKSRSTTTKVKLARE